MIKNEALEGVPLLIVANKQDIKVTVDLVQGNLIFF